MAAKNRPDELRQLKTEELEQKLAVLAEERFRLGFRKGTEAEPLFRRALSIMEKTFGPEHPHVAVVLLNYASLLRQTKHDAKAKKLELRAEQIRAKQA